MPYLKIQVNKEIINEKECLTKVSKLVASKLGKPESYVMVVLEPKVRMSFAGNDEGTVYMELKSIGLQESETEELSRTLCNFVEEEMNIRKDRVYIEFANAPGKLWGWNASTF